MKLDVQNINWQPMQLTFKPEELPLDKEEVIILLHCDSSVAIATLVWQFTPDDTTNPDGGHYALAILNGEYIIKDQKHTLWKDEKVSMAIINNSNPEHR